MATVTGSNTTAFTLNSRNGSVASTSVPIGITIPTGATVTSATITVVVSQDPSMGTSFHVGTLTASGGIAFSKAKGTKSSNAYGDYVDAGITSHSVKVSFSSESSTTASAQITISSISLSVTYTEGAATISSVTAGTVGGSCTLVCSIKNATYKHQVRVRIGDDTYTCIDTTTYSKGSKSISVPLAAAMANSMPSAASVTATLFLITYQSDGTTRIGRNSKTFTLTVPNAAPFAPTASLTHTIIRNNTGNSGIWQLVDGVRLTGSSTAAYGASIKKLQITGTLDSPSYNVNAGSGVATVSTFASSGTHKYTCTVTDTRGHTASAEVSFDVSAYTMLTHSGAAYRASGSTTTADQAGTGLAVRATINHAANVTIKWKASTDSSWTTAINAQSWSASQTVNVKSDLGLQTAYSVQVITDDGKVSLARTYDIGTAAVFLFMDANKKKFGVGAYPDADDQMRVGFGGLKVDGQVVTGFHDSVAPGSYGSTATTIPDLIAELRYSNGAMGSFNLGADYTLNGITVGAGWRHFVWCPHRSGGLNGAGTGDNCNYGTLLLFPLGYQVTESFILRYYSQTIQDLQYLVPPVLTSVSRVNAEAVTGRYGISYGLFDNYAYIRFDVSWIVLELRAAQNSLQWRVKFGSSAWTTWTSV